ncbi:hypothetical protein [Azohydromonas lata]|uniref:hypothetical protein n=1 Tax=Azohydromonas lata TaxID=45677 RepID=UPI0012F52214|nr:hypothetical protein [Azohydromonas lata]
MLTRASVPALLCVEHGGAGLAITNVKCSYRETDIAGHDGQHIVMRGIERLVEREQSFHG